MKQKTNKTKDNEFHALEYMRQVREKSSSHYQADRQSYLERAKEAMVAFKLCQAKNSETA